LPPLDGRRIWFVGIGGAGLSAYAYLVRAWGAEIGGWDRVRTPYLDSLPDAPIEIGPQPSAPEGWEVVVSTAYRDRVPGRSRAELLAELVSLRRSIVVSGAHGKTTTAAMIAFCLDRLGRDPAFAIGGEVPQLGGNARAGEGWFVVEGDESDRTIASLRPEIAVVTNVDLDHHSEFASRAEVQDLFERWLTAVPHVVRGEELEPAGVPLAVAGEHNRRNAAAALAALELAGVPRSEAAPVLGDFHGVGRRLEHVGVVRGVSVYDDYAHNPAKIAAVLAAARELTTGRVVALFQPHLYTRTRHLAHELAASLAAADAAGVTEIYPAREEPIDGVSGKLVVEALATVRPGMDIGWMPALEDGARFLVRRARSGDLLLTLGAGDVDRAARLALEELA
jgi:UDP-N-acetylmuramate--alanine ligase